MNWLHAGQAGRPDCAPLLGCASKKISTALAQLIHLAALLSSSQLAPSTCQHSGCDLHSRRIERTSIDIKDGGHQSDNKGLFNSSRPRKLPSLAAEEISSFLPGARDSPKHASPEVSMQIIPPHRSIFHCSPRVTMRCTSSRSRCYWRRSVEKSSSDCKHTI